MGQCRVCHNYVHAPAFAAGIRRYPDVCSVCESSVEAENLRLELDIAIRQRDETEVLLDNAYRVRDKALVERDVAKIQYHDGMKVLLWFVQLHAKAEADDEIEKALEVAEEKLAIWTKIREEA